MVPLAVKNKVRNGDHDDHVYEFYFFPKKMAINKKLQSFSCFPISGWN